jgi:ABC-type branched-subunit amino acid transport system ATPase component
VAEGTITGLLGSNGSGKTIFIRVFLRAETCPRLDRVRFTGQDITDPPPHHLARAGQHPRRARKLFPP